MNKDLKIALVVIAIILLIAIAEQPSALHQTDNRAYASKQSTSQTASNSPTSSCRHNGIELKGKVQFVDSFPDLKIQYVSSFADINVQFVSSFPDDCGQWQKVTSFPDFTVQVVDSFPDIKVKEVSSFPGMN